MDSENWPYFRIDVRNMATFYCPLSGDQLLMSRKRTGNFVPIPDNTVRIPDIIFQVPDIIFHIPDISVLNSGINFITKLMSGICQLKLAIFRTSNIGVQNMAHRNCPYFGHQYTAYGQ